MRSKTSFFNLTLFRKTVVRFWPLWFLYALVWAIMLPLSLGSSLASAIRYGTNTHGILYALQNLPLQTGYWGGTVIGGIAGCFAAMGAFSHLYFARSTGAFASLPLRREGVFVSVTLAGLLPMLAVNLLVFAVTLLVEASYGLVYLPALLQWLALTSMLGIFFYGFAVLCAQLTGNLVVLPLVYVVLNFTVYVVEYLVTYILGIFVYGFTSSGVTLSVLSPVIRLARSCGVEQIVSYSAAADSYTTVGYYFSGWGYVIGYAAAGLVLLAGSLLLYKRRRMETAGDVVAVNCLKPVFKYCLALGCALCLGSLLFEIVFSGYSYYGTPPYVLALTAFMLLGCFIGYFAAEMLIHKSFAVWRGRGRWLGLLVSFAVIAVLTFSCEYDLIGYEKRAPSPAEVESVSLSVSGDGAFLSEPQNIEAALALHASIVEHKSFHENNSSVYLRLTYTLRDGGTLTRSYRLAYDLNQDTGDVQTLQDLVNTQEAINNRKKLDFAVTAENITYAYVDYRVTDYDAYGSPYRGLDLTAEEANQLYYECILPDIADGTLGRIWLINDEEYYRTVYGCTVRLECTERDREGNYTYQSFYTVPTIHSTRTNAWLEAHGVEPHTEGEFLYDKSYADFKD